MFTSLDEEIDGQERITFGDNSKGKVKGLGKGAISNDHSVTEPPNLYKIKYGCLRYHVDTHTHLHSYKPGSPPSVPKDLGKSTSQPRSRD